VVAPLSSRLRTRQRWQWRCNSFDAVCLVLAASFLLGTARNDYCSTRARVCVVWWWWVQNGGVPSLTLCVCVCVWVRERVFVWGDRFRPDLTPGPGSFDVSKSTSLKYTSSRAAVIHHPVKPAPQAMPFDSTLTSERGPSGGSQSFSSTRGGGTLYKRDRSIAHSANPRNEPDDYRATAGALNYERARHVHDISSEVRATPYGGFSRAQRNNEDSFFSTRRPARRLGDDGETPGPGAYFHGANRASSAITGGGGRASNGGHISLSPRFSSSVQKHGGFHMPCFLQPATGQPDVAYEGTSSRDFVKVRARVPVTVCQRVCVCHCACGP